MNDLRGYNTRLHQYFDINCRLFTYLTKKSYRYLDNVLFDVPIATVEVLFEILVTVLKDESEFLVGV